MAKTFSDAQLAINATNHAKANAYADSQRATFIQEAKSQNKSGLDFSPVIAKYGNLEPTAFRQALSDYQTYSQYGLGAQWLQDPAAAKPMLRTIYNAQDAQDAASANAKKAVQPSNSRTPFQGPSSVEYAAQLNNPSAAALAARAAQSSANKASKSNLRAKYAGDKAATISDILGNQHSGGSARAMKSANARIPGFASDMEESATAKAGASFAPKVGNAPRTGLTGGAMLVLTKVFSGNPAAIAEAPLIAVGASPRLAMEITLAAGKGAAALEGFMSQNAGKIPQAIMSAYNLATSKKNPTSKAEWDARYAR